MREVSAVKRGHRGGLADIFLLVSAVLFVASVALAVSVFLYQQYLQSSGASKIDQLERAKAAFEPSLIQELTRVDDRMRAAGEILGSHTALSALFRMLEATTITTVAFRSFDFEAADAGHMSVKMDGIADSVNSIALQADLFSKGAMITNPIFSNINREVDGVHFSLSGLVDPAAINYAQIVSGLSRTQNAPAPVSPLPASPFEAESATPSDPLAPESEDIL
jgi:hypothetical protein